MSKVELSISLILPLLLIFLHELHVDRIFASITFDDEVANFIIGVNLLEQHEVLFAATRWFCSIFEFFFG